MAQITPSLDGLSRRSFLSIAGWLPLAASQASTQLGLVAEGKYALKKRPIGLELYSVRKELERDLPGTLNQVASMGYQVVEFFAPYSDWTIPYAKEVRRRMDDLGLRCFSTHNNHLESFIPGPAMAKTIELNQVLGTRYLIMSSAPKIANGREGWQSLCGRLTQATTELQKHGLSAGYHNHAAEWAKLDGGGRIMDVIAACTPPEFVLQFDVGTCVSTGEDPVAWIKQNPGRIKSIHLKDWAPGTAADEKGYRVLFGEGVTPWKELIAAADSVGGVEYYLMEQEGSRYGEFETARKCLQNWKKLKSEA